MAQLTIPPEKYLPFLLKGNSINEQTKHRVGRDVFHESEQIRQIDFIFDGSQEGTHRLERLLIFDNSAMAFTRDILEGLFSWDSVCQYMDPFEMDDLIENAREKEDTCWMQRVYKHSFENIHIAVSAHNRTNMRARHVGQYRKCSCNAPKTGALQFIGSSEFKELYYRLFCLCKYAKEQGLSIEDGGQNINMITCHANAPVLSTIPKDDRKFFDPFEAAKRSSIVTWMAYLQNVLSCFRNGDLRWIDGYISPDAEMIILENGKKVPIVEQLDIQTSRVLPEKDRKSLPVTTNPVTHLANICRVAFEESSERHLQVYKVAKAVRWQLALLALSEKEKIRSATTESVKELHEFGLALEETDLGPKVTRVEDSEEWLGIFLTMLNPLLSNGLNLRSGDALLDWEETVLVPFTIYLYAAYGGNVSGMSEAISHLEYEAIRQNEFSEGEVAERKKVALEHFCQGALHVSLGWKAPGSERVSGKHTHLGVSRYIAHLDASKYKYVNGITCVPPEAGTNAVSLTRDKRTKIDFKLDGASYRAKVIANQLVVKRVGKWTRVKGGLYRISGLNIMGSGLNWQTVGRDDESISSLGNLMLSGSAGVDAADWLFRKLIYSEVSVSSKSSACYIPEGSKVEKEGLPIMNAELCDSVLIGHHAFTCMGGIIIPTEGYAADLMITRRAIGYNVCSFKSGDEYEKQLMGLTLEKYEIGSAVAL